VSEGHQHRWNYSARCTDPACPAIRCRYLEMHRRSPIRTSWYRCSQAAVEGRDECERHAKEASAQSA
jgi:hypothetical protein